MLAYRAPLALLAFALAAVMVADARAVALFALVPDPIMLAYRASLALLAAALDAVVAADARAFSFRYQPLRSLYIGAYGDCGDISSPVVAACSKASASLLQQSKARASLQYCRVCNCSR
jgi:hypothetical protein